MTVEKTRIVVGVVAVVVAIVIIIIMIIIKSSKFNPESILGDLAGAYQCH
jgi:hypothetical protein